MQPKQKGSDISMCQCVGDQDMAEGQQDDTTEEPLKICRWFAERPHLSFGLGVGGHISLLVATAALFLLDYDIFPTVFDKLPLILKDDVDFLRYSSWVNRNSNPDIIRHTATFVGNHSERSIPGEALVLYYESESGGTVFTRSNLRRVQEIESKFGNNMEYKSQFCLVDSKTSSCAKPVSILRYFDGTYADIDPVFNDPHFDNIIAVLYAANTNPVTKPALQYHLGKNSDITNITAYSGITRSMMFVGMPLHGYYSDTDRTQQQKDKVKKFMINYFSKAAEKIAESSLGDMNVIYSSVSIFAEHLSHQVILDMLLASCSLGFIFLFMWLQTGSLWVTTWSMFSIITSFFGANLIYRLVCDYRFFGIFHVMAIFIILGIGADDVFIFYDTWKEEGLKRHPNVAMRLSSTYKKAAAAMFFTSATTALAFFVGATSPLLSVSSFGLFSGLLILVNYVNVILFLPSVVIYYHYKYEDWTWPCFKRCTPQKNQYSQDDSHKLADLSASCEVTVPKVDVDREPIKNRHIVRFFQGPYYRLVTHRFIKWIIIVLMLIFTGACVFYVTRLKVNDEETRYLNPKSNFGKFLDRTNNAFRPSQLDNSMMYSQMILVWGLKEQDRTSCHNTDFECMGRTVWDNRFSLDSANSQLALLNFCRTLRNLPKEQVDKLRIRRDIVSGELEIKCFIGDMQDYLENELQLGGKSFPFLRNSSIRLQQVNPGVYGHSVHDISSFETGLDFWLFGSYDFQAGIPSALLSYDSLIGESRTPGITREIEHRPGFYIGTTLKYASIIVNTTMKSPTLGYNEGLQVRDAWEHFMHTQLKVMPPELQGGFQTTFVWNWLKVKLTLADSAIRGILIGLLVAFPVLLIATMNIFVGFFAFVSLCCVIVSVVSIMPMIGWRLGVLESLNLVLVVGLSVDYIVHLAEAYCRSTCSNREGRVRNMLTEVGVSVLSGAATTLGASSFMLLAQILFFNQFAVFIFSTIGFSLLYALAFFTPLMAIWGPQNNLGSLKWLIERCKRKNSRNDEEEDSTHL